MQPSPLGSAFWNLGLSLSGACGTQAAGLGGRGRWGSTSTLALQPTQDPELSFTIKLLFQCCLFREASATSGGPKGQSPSPPSPPGSVTVSLGLIPVLEGCPAISITPSHSECLSSRQAMCSLISLEPSASHSFCQTLSPRALWKELACVLKARTWASLQHLYNPVVNAGASFRRSRCCPP